ncbi:MAG: TldD/PmbA family protein [Candidatus Heimdallarchaeum endolithica]|uniref:TldD/PmbA family protein n=1 Tax=Candidatus Heimdallarchaeum endolithica TaxID=2876572 RepID=A0A9Y1BS40_9ARCH|nr:MAG: TldD/PmbA family protein [Candidatus Heimdallarchaeum endolithica]
MVSSDLKDKIQKALDIGLEYAKKNGAEHAEGFGILEKTFNLELEKNKPKHNLGILHGIAFRVIANNAYGFAYTSSFKSEDIQQTVKAAIQNAKTKKPDPDIVPFPETKKAEHPLKLDKKFLDMGIDESVEPFEQLLPSKLPKNLYFLTAMGNIDSGETFLKNTSGIDIYKQEAGYGLGIGFLSIHGFPIYDFHFEGAREWGKIIPQEITKKAIEKTLAVAKPQTLSLSGEYPIILPPEGSYGLFGGLFMILTDLLRGDKASRGETVFSDKIGEKVAADNFTLIDDPLHPDMITSTNYDAEGVPTQKTTLIENGILQTYYLNSYYANKLNMESNGKATRGGFFGGNPIKRSPSIGNYATIIEPGDSSKEEMIQETKEGFMLQNFMGIHMSDFSSGRFSVTGSGWYIKNGEIAFPVQDITISGTIPELIQNIDLISKERRQGLNNEVPYIRVSKLSVTAKKMDFKIRIGMKILKTLMALGLVKNPFI